MLRPGGIEADAIEDLIGVRLRMPAPDDAVRAPGMLQSHYAPQLPLRLNATSVAAGEALLAFGPKPLSGAATVLNLSEHGNLQHAAARLFAMLHDLDRPDYDGIAVMHSRIDDDSFRPSVWIRDTRRYAHRERIHHIPSRTIRRVHFAVDHVYGLFTVGPNDEIELVRANARRHRWHRSHISVERLVADGDKFWYPTQINASIRIRRFKF